MRTTLFSLAALMALSSFTATESFAALALVTHSTGGVLINEDFESPNTPPAPPIGWTSNPSGTNLPSVENPSTVAGNPPAFERYQYLALRRQPEGVRKTFGSYTTGTITASFAFYIPDVTDAPGGLPARENTSGVFPEFLKSDDSGFAGSEAWIGFAHRDFVNGWTSSTIAAGRGGVYYYGPGEFALKAGGNTFSFTLNEWHQATISYDLDATPGSTTAFTITIDGTTLDALPATNTLASGTVMGFQFFNNSAGSSDDKPGFVDALPEPAMISVLAIFPLLAARQRRPLGA